MQLVPTGPLNVDKRTDADHGLSALFAAAMALSSLAPQAALAPDATTVAVDYLSYTDFSQEGSRMRVQSPTLYLHAPVGTTNSIEASATLDTMSGASPEFHNTLSGASGKGISDRRQAADIKVHHYFERAAVSLGAARSTEHDYDSHSWSLDGQWSTSDQNTTVAAGIGNANDMVGNTRKPALHEPRQTHDYLLGVTQVISPVALLQSNITYNRGTGYFNDDYKALDKRPNSRDQFAWLTRLRYFVPSANAAIHLDYRYYRDTWDVRAHTIEAAWYQDLNGGWTIKPSVRFYSQHAAYFYDEQFPPDVFGNLYSADTRLGSFGAMTLGLDVSKAMSDDLTVNLKAASYQQRASWHWGGNGSQNMEPFKAYWWSVGLVRRFP